MYDMFYECSSLHTLDLSGWDTSSVTGMYAMDKIFNGCYNLTTVTISQSGANLLDKLLELSTNWVIKDTTTTMETVKASPNWTEFTNGTGSTTLTFTRIIE
jgi:surface protein